MISEEFSYFYLELNQSNSESTREGGGDSGRGSLNSTDTCMFIWKIKIFLSIVFFIGVPDGSEKSTNTLSDGFSSVRIRNRPPLPHSNSGNKKEQSFFNT